MAISGLSRSKLESYRVEAFIVARGMALDQGLHLICGCHFLHLISNVRTHFPMRQHGSTVVVRIGPEALRLAGESP